MCERKKRITIEDEVCKTDWLVDDTPWKIKINDDTTFIYFDWIINTDNWVVYENTGS